MSELERMASNIRTRVDEAGRGRKQLTAAIIMKVLGDYEVPDSVYEAIQYGITDGLYEDLTERGYNVEDEVTDELIGETVNKWVSENL